MKSFMYFAVLAVGAGHAQGADYEDIARVVSVAPRLESYKSPRKECPGQNDGSNERGLSGSVVGGLAGAVLGAQVGKGNGRVVAAAAGAATGAVVGDRLQNGPSRPAPRCRVVYDALERQNGFLVTYEYEGRTMTDFMKSEPGETVRIRVNVQAIR